LKQLKQLDFVANSIFCEKTKNKTKRVTIGEKTNVLKIRDS